jgi:hypothetical protein
VPFPQKGGNLRPHAKLLVAIAHLAMLLSSQIMKHIALSVIVTSCLAISARAEDNKAPSAESKSAQVDLNKDAYRRAARAASAETFEGAKLMIDQIDKKAITDPGVASYVDLSSRFASLCAELGIPRDAKPDWSAINELNPAALTKALTTKGIQNVPVRAAALIGDLSVLKQQLPIYNDLDRSLSQKYGPPLDLPLPETKKKKAK